jgi:hypothetical protein
MTAADWMSMTPADWVDMVQTQLDRSYADYMALAPADWWARMVGGGYAPGVQAWGGTRQGRYPDSPRQRGGAWRRERDDSHGECRRCRSDDCECRCCLDDVDFAIYAHLGERRVLQLVLENERHREREVTLDLSEWTTRGGRPAPVKTVVVEPRTFVLPPCGEQKVIIAVEIAPTDQAPGSQATAGQVTGEASAATSQRTPLDVDECLVAVADLRFTGCDRRPLRLAIAIQPRDCGAYWVDCGCGCC